MATAKKASSKRAKAAPAKRSERKAVPSPAKATAGVADKPEKPAKPTQPAKAAKKPKPPKPVRDSYSMPQAEFDALKKLKGRAKSLGVPAKRSEILRAGMRLLQRMDDEHFAVLLASVQSDR